MWRQRKKGVERLIVLGSRHMLNVYYCQAEGENEKQNQTSNVSLSDNICSCWSKGWFCIWTILVCSILLYNVGMIGNMWVRRRVEIMSVTSTGYPHSDWQLPLTLENAVSARHGVSFLSTSHLNPAFSSRTMLPCNYVTTNLIQRKYMLYQSGCWEVFPSPSP